MPIYFLFIRFFLILSSQVVSSCHVFQSEFFLLFSSPTYVLYASLINLLDLITLIIYLVKSIEYEAPHCAFFSIFLLLLLLS